MGWLAERIDSLDNALKIIVFGLRFDVIVICMLWFIPAVMLLLLPKTVLLNKVQSFIARVWLSLSTAVMVFLEISTPAFIDQYDTRPNRIFFEYLNNPVEVLKTSILEYPWHFVVAMILMYFLIRFLMRFNHRLFNALTPWPVWLRIVFLPCLLVLLVLGARSSLDHRPANASTAAFSNDQLVNTLGLSSTYTVFSALYNLKNESSDNSIYGRMDEKEIVSIIREQSMIPADQP